MAQEPINMAKQPQQVHLHRKSKCLALDYGDGEQYSLPCEYLRVYSPSAEVRGHGGEAAILQIGKIAVNITAVNAMGHYAIQLVFDDGHDSGIYTWPYLYELCSHYEQYWQDYLDRLSAAGAGRDPDVQVMHFQP